MLLKPFRLKVALSAFMALYMVGVSAHTDGAPIDRLHVSGFVGVGIAHTSANNFLGEQNSDSEILDLGLNFYVDLTDNLTLNGQLSYRRLGDNISDDNPRVDYASLTYTSNALNFGEQTYSLGRVKVKQGVYNDFRDVPTSKPTIILPQAVYLDIFRNVLLSVDGLLINTTHKVNDGQLSAEFATGKINFDDNFSSNLFGYSTSGEWEEDDAIVFDLRYTSTQFMFGVTYTELVLNYYASLGDGFPVSPFAPLVPLVDGSIGVDSYTFFVQRDVNMLQLTAEYVRRNFTSNGLFPQLLTINRPMEGYYLQGRYPISSSVWLTARWERFFLNRNDKDGIQQAMFGLPDWTTKSITQTLGINWQISRNWSMFAEVHKISGSGYYPPIAATSINALEDRSSILLAAELVYRF